MNVLFYIKRNSPAARPDGVAAEIVRGQASIEASLEEAKYATASWSAIDLDDLSGPVVFEGHAVGAQLNAKRGS